MTSGRCEPFYTLSTDPQHVDNAFCPNFAQDIYCAYTVSYSNASMFQGVSFSDE